MLICIITPVVVLYRIGILFKTSDKRFSSLCSTISVSWNEPYNICHIIKGINGMGDLPEKHNLVIFIIRFKSIPAHVSIHSCCPYNSCRQTGMIPETGYIALASTAVNLWKKHLPFTKVEEINCLRISPIASRICNSFLSIISVSYSSVSP